MSDRLNRVCLKLILWGVAILFFGYILNHWIRPFVTSDRIETAIYAGSLITFYIFFFTTGASVSVLVLNVIRKWVFP